jgi:hypothetical protein
VDPEIDRAEVAQAGPVNMKAKRGIKAWLRRIARRWRRPKPAAPRWEAWNGIPVCPLMPEEFAPADDRRAPRRWLDRWHKHRSWP